MTRRPALLATLLALCLPTATSAAEQTWLAYVLGEHVGRWDVIGDGPAYKETLNIVQAQEKGRTTVIESFALQPEGAGLRWEHYVHAGPIDRRERGTIAGGRFWREKGGQSAFIKLKALPMLRPFPDTTKSRLIARSAQVRRIMPCPRNSATCSTCSTATDGDR